MTSIFKPNFFVEDTIDIFFKDLFDNSNKFFQSVLDNSVKLNYPIDIKETKNGLEIDIVAIGLDKQDIKVEVENNILRVSYDKPATQKDNDVVFYKRGITRKSFNFAWQISKCDMDAIDVKLDKGLLQIFIPWKEEKKTIKQITIN
jgi:HSP20 family protein